MYMRFPLSVAFCLCSLVLLSCRQHGSVVSLEEFSASADSIGRANGVVIWVKPNQYEAYGVSREAFADKKRWMSSFCKDTSCVYVIGVSGRDALSLGRHKSPLDTVKARYWQTEELRNHRKNRVGWREFKAAAHKVNPDVVLVRKKEWKKQRMLRSEMRSALSVLRPLNPEPVTYLLEKRKDGTYTSGRKVTDSVELATLKAQRYRWNAVANGMLGAAYTEKPYAGLVIGAEGYRLSESETLWFHVYIGNCYPFPGAKPTFRIPSGTSRVSVRAEDGSAKDVYITLRDSTFHLLQNPPFRYTFTASFEYGGQWYYVFLCEDPSKCLCRPIERQCAGFRSNPATEREARESSCAE